MLYGYTRCSTVEQAQDGKSTLDLQAQKIKGIAMARGADQYELVILSDPGVSGGMPLERRPAGKDLIDNLRKGDIVIAAKLDRIFRDAGDALHCYKLFEEMGVGLIIADFGLDTIGESPVGKLIFTVLSGCAEFERNRINERTNDGRKAKKSRGGCIGNTPFGFRREGKGAGSVLAPDPRETRISETVAQACTGFAAWSAANHFRKDAKDQVGYVSRALLAAGLRDRAGHDLKWNQVRRLIDRHYAQQFKSAA